MKIYNYMLVLFALMSIGACTKDLGNYDYNEINELTISGVNQEYLVRTGLDTLRITPDIKMTENDTDNARYSYMWILRYGTLSYDTLAYSKDLSFPILLNPVDHDLYYRVLDKETGVTWAANIKIKVSTPYSRGLLIMGEDEDGYAEAEMLAMLSDTVHIPNLLSKTDLPRLREPVGLFHTGGSEAYIRLWAMTGSGSYFLNRSTMTATTNNNFGRYLFASDLIHEETLHPIVIAPQIRAIGGAIGSTLYRALITIGGDVFASAPIIMGGDFYNNPINRLASNPNQRIPAAPYLLYPINSMNNIMWYDNAGQRFINFTGIAVATTSTLLTDGPNDIFPWNQPQGRKLIYAENTRNTDGGSTNGNSFAILKDADNSHHIYKFYANGANPAKRGAYVVKSIATDFDKADFYAFSSNRSVLFYAVGNKLYAYDYNPGFEKNYTFPEIDETITMLKFDTQIDHTTNSLYVATYTPSTKGTLTRYLVGQNPNLVEILPQINSQWTGLVKIKDINWRAVN